MQPGDLVAGRYRLLDRIGAGSMGVVWRATDVELRRTVALKCARDNLDVARTRREAQVAAGVHHPNVVTLFDVVDHAGALCLILEYVPAPTLADVLAARGPLAPAEAAVIGAQIAAALEAVHAAGIVHRDVKPANVMLGGDGRAKLADFGVSRAMWAEQTLAGTGFVVGTPAYLAPEIASGGEPTAAADMFALGATLYRAVEGESPYGTADNPLALLQRAAAGQIRSAGRSGPLESVLHDLLSPDPTGRPDARAVRERLSALGGPARTVEMTARHIAPRARRSRRRRRAAAGVVGLAVIVAAGALAAGGGERGTPAAAGRADALGDPRTADPCALVHPPSLARYGTATPDPRTGPFNSCTVRVSTSAGQRATVQLALLARVGAGENERARPNGCSRALDLPAASSVVVQVDQAPGGSPMDHCAIADAVRSLAADVVAGGVLPRRTGSIPAASLATVHACDMFGEPVSAADWLARAQPRSGFADWSCRWAAQGHALDLTFDRGAVPDASHGAARTWSDHPARVRAEGADGCEVVVVHRAIGRGRAELATLRYVGPGAAQQVCARAETLAAAVAARLPAVPRPTAAPTRTPAPTPVRGAGVDQRAKEAERARQATECALVAGADPARAAQCAVRFGR